MRFFRCGALLGVLVACLNTIPAAAQPQRHADLIHSDLPLWTTELWPYPFVAGETFGCRHNILLGDWIFEESSDRSSWFSLRNYGVFHCMLVVTTADDHAGLDQGETNYGFLVELGRARSKQGEVELWALQTGSRPGSDYLLLARKPAPAPISFFDVLQRECPRSNVRSGPGLGILLTNYCAINSQSELIRLARSMAKRPPLGRLTFIPSGSGREQNADVP